MAERRRRAVAVVFGFSLIYNALAVGICLAGWMSPLLAAVLMPASSLASLFLVVMNIPESEKLNRGTTGGNPLLTSGDPGGCERPARAAP